MMPTLTLMAKAPCPGMVKTRLMPMCSAQEAAEVASILLRLSLEHCMRHWPGRVVLAVWPDTVHPIFSELSDRYGITLIRQSAGDLGEKMHSILISSGSNGGSVAVMGSDIPHLPCTTLTRAYDALSRRANVVGPTRDGGFFFLGLGHPAPGLFSGIDWGTPDVYARMLCNAKALALNFDVTLDPIDDIDCAADLQRVVAYHQPLRNALRAERICVRLVDEVT